jgi:hypothetical protein
MNAQLAAVLEDFDAASRRLDSLVESFPSEAWTTRPDPSSWSAAECVAHLNLSAEAYLPRMEEALARARPLDGSARVRYRADPLGWLVSRVVGPLPRIGGRRRGGVKTPAAFVPGGEGTRDEILSRFRSLQERQTAVVQASEGRAVDRVKVRSPFIEALRFNLYSTFLILSRHQHRHLQQAEEAASSAGFAG